MLLEEWCLKYGKELMYNESDEESLVFEPAIFNISQRVMRVHKGGGDDHLRKSFEIDRYLDIARQKIKDSLEYKIINRMKEILGDDNIAVPIIAEYLYPSYVYDLIL